MLAFTLMAGCSGDQNEPPVAYAGTFSTLEEQSVAGTLNATDPEGAALAYGVATSRHGRVTSLTSDGAFMFEPDVDFFGTAGFEFVVTDDEGQSSTATASVVVENVNDPPRLLTIPELHNSPETETVEYQVVVTDPDQDEHTFSIAVANPAVVDATVDPQTGRLYLKAHAAGTTSVEVTVADAAFSDSSTFTFAADDATKARAFRYSDLALGAVSLENVSDKEIEFVLEHNGFPVFENVDHMVEYVEALPNQYAGEDFPHKLWRFIRDSVYHDVPFNANRMYYDPWVTLNSLGWGFCGHVAGTFVVIAQAAGYEARVWGLSGHVVPEIKVDGQWRMYDPDLAVYYKTADGRIAGVEELAANPALITNPIDPIFADSWYQYPYGQMFADFYSSTYNNYDGVHTFLPAHDTPPARIVLPPRAKLTYPGQFTEPPTGYDGNIPYEIRAYRQALIEPENGWTGEIQLPWMAWEITGSGQVGIDNELFAAGSPELTARLRDTELPVTSLRIYSNAGIRIVLFVNAVRFEIRPRTSVSIRGFDVWGMNVSPVTLAPTEGGGAALDSWLLKPLPVTLN